MTLQRPVRIGQTAPVYVLFQSATKQKRTVIRGFVYLLDRLGELFYFPQSIPRHLGMAVRRQIEQAPETAIPLGKVLAKLGRERTPEQELAVLKDYAAGKMGQGGNPRVTSQQKERSAKTTFRLNRPAGAVKVTASQGRLEVRLDTDFSAKDRKKLEKAIAAFLAELEEQKKMPRKITKNQRVTVSYHVSVVGAD